MNLWELVAKIPYRFVGNDRFCGEVSAVTTDCHKVTADTLFVCVRTPWRDGHEDALTAYENGCRLFLAERSLAVGADATVLVTEDTAACLGAVAAKCYGHPARELTVLGVTGSAGKSSVLDLTAAVLRQCGEQVATIGSDGVTVGGLRYPRGNTLPDAAALQRLLRELSAKGITVVLLELSTYMLAQKAHFPIPFTAVLLTGQEARMENAAAYRQNDRFRDLQSALFTKEVPVWLLPDVGEVPSAPHGVRVLTFGERGMLSAKHLGDTDTDDGFFCRAAITLDDGIKREISLPVPGDFAIINCLAALALCRVVGIEPQRLLTEIERIRPKAHLECLGCYEGRYIYTDAGFSPAALERALSLLRRRTVGKLTVLLGSVGGRTYARRAALGRVATEVADLAYFTADDPDFEDPAAICAQMKAEADPDRYVILPDRAHAIRRAVLELRPGDTLLLFGKGADRHQLIDGSYHPFSERENVEEAMRAF